MSYILDALKRADAERALGEVPTLNASAAPWLDEAPASRQRGGRSGPAGLGRGLALGAAGAAGALGLALLAAWAFWPTVPAAPPVAAAAVPTPVPAPAPAAVAASASPLAPAPSEVQARALAAAPPSSPPAAAEPAPARPRSEAKAPPPARDRPAARTERAERTDAARTALAPPPAARPAETPRAAPSTTPNTTPNTTPPPPERLPRLEDLSAEQRRSIPPLSVSGAVHSADAASRMLILNGQLAREGDNISADLVLLRIEPRRAVLEQRGQRFTISY